MTKRQQKKLCLQFFMDRNISLSDLSGTNLASQSTLLSILKVQKLDQYWKQLQKQVVSSEKRIQNLKDLEKELMKERQNKMRGIQEKLLKLEKFRHHFNQDYILKINNSVQTILNIPINEKQQYVPNIEYKYIAQDCKEQPILISQQIALLKQKNTEGQIKRQQEIRSYKIRISLAQIENRQIKNKQKRL